MGESKEKYEALINNVKNNNIDEFINQFYDTITPKNGDSTKEEHTRYLSWEHCYNAFGEKFREDELTDDDKDYLALHLAFYLASWGMYRGSSFLLQRDYKTHTEVVKLLFTYKHLREFIPQNQSHVTAATDSLFGKDDEDGLYNKLTKAYAYTDDRNADKDIASDTLVTKILLGTLGCIPAFDRFFKDGLKIWNSANPNKKITPTSTVNANNFESLCDFCKNLNDLKYKMHNNENIPYPPMKLVDMYFWQIGKEKEDIDKDNKSNQSSEA